MRRSTQTLNSTKRSILQSTSIASWQNHAVTDVRRSVPGWFRLRSASETAQFESAISEILEICPDVVSNVRAAIAVAISP